MAKREMILDRKEAIAANQDATGKVWKIRHVRGTALYEVAPENYEGVTNIPEKLQGRWTKKEWLQDQIREYCNNSWDMVKVKASTKKVEKSAGESTTNQAAA